ncbi:hypothetical protein D9758_019073 [Tetrapyrgos nigripes]|uniref:Nephrocystin 3-like N-terminal domain-containing protein n=1 Tax=Tetrapyrgos nigripes TaxID=182062 RepID=A0A8H5ESA0_9AGAR|nr:hypothetical protein D9758_019073 [Tetrapyrgos nigripes]
MDTGPVARAAENDMCFDGQIPQGSRIDVGRDVHMNYVQRDQNQTINNNYSQTVNSNNTYDNRYIQTGGSNTIVVQNGVTMDKIKDWLKAPDPFANYNAAYEKMTKGTGEWLLKDSRLIQWKENGGLLRLQGKAGSGKTFLLTNVITSLKTEGHTVFYFYFDTLNQTKVKGTCKGLLSSIMLSTGIEFNQTVLQDLYQQYASDTNKSYNQMFRASYRYWDMREGSASPLHYASSISLSNIMLLLIEEGANVNAQGGQYGTPLLAAASKHPTSKQKEDAVRLLLEKGADVNAQDGEYGTPLTAAVPMGNIGTVRLLLEKGADVNAQGGKYHTPLLAAVSRQNKDTVRLLLEEGADVNAQDGEYGTPLQAALFQGYIDIAKLLLEKGADVNAQGGHDCTPLMAAASMVKIGTVRLLLEKGADVNAQGGTYDTPLQAASLTGLA